MTLYNDNEPSACAWMRGLMDAGLITKGKIDERSICNIQPEDLRRVTRFHAFAGIGGWGRIQTPELKSSSD